MTVRTRFAPSPTGYLHIGGVRTAIFNWLYARKHHGQFLLRIDDTDTDRNVEESVKPILDGLTWLGLHWNGPTIYQSKRREIYWKVVQQLIESGNAYACSATQKELDEARDMCAKAKEQFVWRGIFRDQTPGFNMAHVEQGGYAVRLKVPTSGKLVVNDHIRGNVEWDWSLVSDPVIVRSDGMPLYNLATAVDDYMMSITHIIRAEEHLSNTPIQVAIWQAMKWGRPNFAHIPFVCAPASRQKLSKRDLAKFVTPAIIENLVSVGITPEEINSREDLNPAALGYYKELGYLPQAVFNYLARLGWAKDGTSEKIAAYDIIQSFDFSGVNSSPGSFDPQKMYWLQGEYMKEIDLDQKAMEALIYLGRAGLVKDYEAAKPMVRKLVEICGDRIKVFSDVIQYGAFFFRPPVYNTDTAKTVLKRQILESSTAIYTTVAVDEWKADSLEQKLRDFCHMTVQKVRDYVHPIRYAISGQLIGPSLFHSMELLGREECLHRLRMALAIAV